jgi:hypothetical protein
MPEILVLCPGREGRHTLEAQLHRLELDVAYFNTRSELRSGALDRRVKAIVVDLFDGEGRPVLPLLRDLNRDVPELRIVVSYKPSPAALDDGLDAATSGIRAAFAARPFNDVGQLLASLLFVESARAPSTAEAILLRVVPLAATVPVRRFLTLASVNPVPQLDIDSVARFCGVTYRTLYRHLEGIGPPKLLLSALAWPQVTYLLTGLHWSARQAAAYCRFRRPAMLIDLLGDYLESGLWKLGLDPSVDGVAAATAERDEAEAGWPARDEEHQEGHASVLTSAGDATANEGTWQHLRLEMANERITALASTGMAPLEIVRRLWRRHELDPGHLYRGVVRTVETLQPPRGPADNDKV